MKGCSKVLRLIILYLCVNSQCANALQIVLLKRLPHCSSSSFISYSSHPCSTKHRLFSTSLFPQHKIIDCTSILNEPVFYKIPKQDILREKLHSLFKYDSFFEKSGLIGSISGKELSEIAVRLALDVAIVDYYRLYPNYNVYKLLSDCKENMLQCIINSQDVMNDWAALRTPKDSVLDYWHKAPYQEKEHLSVNLSKISPRVRLGNLLNSSAVINAVSLQELPVYLSKNFQPLPLSALSGYEANYFRITFSDFNFHQDHHIRLIFVNDWSAKMNKVHFRVRTTGGNIFFRRDLYMPSGRDDSDDLFFHEIMIKPLLLQEQKEVHSTYHIIKCYLNPYYPPLIDFKNCSGKIYLRNIVEDKKIKKGDNFFPYIQFDCKSKIKSIYE